MNQQEQVHVIHHKQDTVQNYSVLNPHDYDFDQKGTAFEKERLKRVHDSSKMFHVRRMVEMKRERSEIQERQKKHDEALNRKKEKEIEEELQRQQAKELRRQEEEATRLRQMQIEEQRKREIQAHQTLQKKLNRKKEIQR